MTSKKNLAKGRSLADKIAHLKKSRIRRTIEKRIKEFEELQKRPAEDIFSELCFCITTANCAAESCIRMQRSIAGEYSTLSARELSKRLKEHGYRFPNKRAEYIIRAREHTEKIMEKIRSGTPGKELREWLADNVLGLGYKEASHFLRNIGYKDIAIIDFHILDVLAEHDLMEKPKTMSRKKYLEIERILKGLADETGLNLSELDLYLWYMETGKVLK